MGTHDFVIDHDGGPPIERGRLAVWLFVVAEAMLFAGLVSAWLVLRAADPAWPREEHLRLLFGIGLTACLVTSSLTASWAARGGGTRRALLVTIALGALFAAGQALEYSHLFAQGITPALHPRWAAFFALTACHGLHVLVGLAWLAGLAVRGRKGAVLEYGVLYWHFVDAVWLVLLVLLYVVR